MSDLSMTLEEFYKVDRGAYLLLDVRDDESYQYGFIPTAINIPSYQMLEALEGGEDAFLLYVSKSIECNHSRPEYLHSKKVIVYCKRGEVSLEIAEKLCDCGINAFSLEGGYMGWLMSEMNKVDADEESLRERQEEIELSIRKKFKKQLFSKFAKAINEYDMLQPGDKVAVCISGGKDSMLMAKLFQELKRHNKFEFDLEFLVMDPGYNEANRKVIENNAKLMGIPITVYESDIFDAVYDIEKNPCYLCARMRRGHLYSEAKRLGCNKIALGHHYDDVIETILMGMMYGAQVQTMMPKLHSTNFEGMELIRPLYLIREEDIIHWRDYNGLHFIQCACKFTDTCTTCRSDGSSVSKRMEIKHLIADLVKVNPYVEQNIFKSVENVNLSTVIAYKKDGVVHHFLDSYNE